MGKLGIRPLKIAGAAEVAGEVFRDTRGVFQRVFCTQELAGIIGERQVMQMNHSVTVEPGAVRGLHFQHLPYAEMKLVRCLRGAVFDVCVDLRANSATFMQWEAVELRPERANMLVIPEGCAHGFQVLDPNSELLYLHTAAYAPEAEGGMRHDDPRIGVEWPLPVRDLSARDRAHPLLDGTFSGLKI